MKFFKCGQCQSPYKIDETKVNTTQVVITCNKCGAKNKLRFGPTLVAQTKDGVQQFSLKEGLNRIGRKTEKSEAEIQLADPYMSRNHACVHVEKKEDKIYISLEDSGSLNGTFNKSKNRLKKALRYPFTTEDYFISGLTKLSIKI